ncbi:uncharacterized protein K02A2.6-like [Aedes albopictus]|uniref:RNA-directed DNA polymerase n=1 Tax=Aedes albopictus TaxID=7160 RepID=A0ABM1ZW90_AEDAL
MAQMAQSMDSSRAIQQFRCDDIEKHRLFNEWRVWKGALECYFEAYDIEDQRKKRAILLHLGGPQLQRWYDVAINALDGFFQPCRQDCLERHKLKQMKQKEGERFADFMLRLRQQASDCGFDKYSNEIRDVLTDIFLTDAVVEGCASTELRRRILQQDRSLAEIESLGVALESIDIQVKDLNGSSKVASNGQQAFKITAAIKGGHDRMPQNTRRDPKKFIPPRDNLSYPKIIRCYNCGRRDHISTDRRCPARNIVCHGCKVTGHFESCCRLRGSKKKALPDKDRIRAVEEDKVAGPPVQHNPEKTYYAFYSGNDTNVLSCEVGGVKLDLLIDSGSDANLIPDTVWESLKQDKIRVRQCVKGSARILKGYASDMPLPILGTFVADVKVGTKSTAAEFYVVQGGQRSLLGDKTSKELGILKVGLDAYHVTSDDKAFSKIKDIQVHIHMDPNAKPVFQPIRRVPIPLEDAVNRKLDQLLTKDIIEVKQGPASWVSPIVVVGKHNGEPRICLDLRRVNEAVLRERHPMPVVDEYIARLGKGRFWSKLDIKDAFLQVELAPESRDVTVFITNKGLFRFKRLPFGLVTAPELFQKVMDQILAGCEGTSWYLDDVIIEGSTREEHDERLKQVLKRFEDRGVELNWDKCVFGVTKVDFLGHTISSDGVIPAKDKVVAIQSFRRPENEAEVRSFLGLANYLNKFIPNLAILDEPLRTLTKKDSKFTWTEQHQQSFDSIKAAMVEILRLGFFNKDHRTTIMTDASPIGLGAILIQTDSLGNSRVVTCASKSLTDTEKRYCQTEKEALAIVWSVERFQIYLYGRQFDILTDCKALVYLFTERSRPCARIERWVLRLQAFDYLVTHISGDKNLADVLSRLSSLKLVPFDQRDEMFVKHVALSSATSVALRWDEIIEASQKDLEIQEVLEAVDKGNIEELPISFRVIASELCRFGEVLLRSDRIVVPVSLRDRVIRIAHEGHLGMRTMKSHLRTAVWWPKMDLAIEAFVKKCRGCLLVSTPDPPQPMVRKEMPNGAWEDIAIDFLGPLPNGETLLVVVDYYSRYLEVCEMQRITTKHTIDELGKIFCRYGVPLTIRADNGPQFSANCEEFKSFCEEFGIRLVNTIPYWPQQNDLFLYPGTVRSSEDGKEYRRNVADLKRIEPEEAAHAPHGESEVTIEGSPKEAHHHQGQTDHVPLEIAPTCSKRVRKEPSRFSDYIPHYFEFQ